MSFGVGLPVHKYTVSALTFDDDMEDACADIKYQQQFFRQSLDPTYIAFDYLQYVERFSHISAAKLHNSIQTTFVDVDLLESINDIQLLGVSPLLV